MLVAGFRRERAGRRGRAALARIASDPTFELLPLKSVDEQIAVPAAAARASRSRRPLPRASTPPLTVATRLAGDGFRVVPHLSARMVRDRAHLRDIVAALAAVGIGRIFVVGGDEQHPGAYADGLSLLRAICARSRRRSRRSACRATPKATQSIPDDTLLRALREKAAVRHLHDDPALLRPRRRS